MEMQQFEAERKIKKHKRWLEGHADGERAEFFNADLRGAFFMNVDLSGAEFMNVEFTGASFMNSVMLGTEFRNTVRGGKNTDEIIVQIEDTST